MGKALELGACLYALIGAAVVTWGIWRAWVRPKDSHTVDLSQRHLRTSWNLRDELTRLFLVEDASSDMSSVGADVSLQKGVDHRDWQPSATPLPGIAMPGNADNTALTDNADNTDVDNAQLVILPAEIRDMIRFQAKAEAIADMMSAGIIGNQAKAIETIFHCTRASSSRPESTYQKALGLITRLAKPAKTENVGDMIERVAREVASEQR